MSSPPTTKNDCYSLLTLVVKGLLGHCLPLLSWARGQRAPCPVPCLQRSHERSVLSWSRFVYWRNKFIDFHFNFFQEQNLRTSRAKTWDEWSEHSPTSRLHLNNGLQLNCIENSHNLYHYLTSHCSSRSKALSFTSVGDISQKNMQLLFPRYWLILNCSGQFLMTQTLSLRESDSEDKMQGEKSKLVEQILEGSWLLRAFSFLC